MEILLNNLDRLFKLLNQRYECEVRDILWFIKHLSIPFINKTLLPLVTNSQSLILYIHKGNNYENRMLNTVMICFIFSIEKRKFKSHKNIKKINVEINESPYNNKKKRQLWHYMLTLPYYYNHFLNRCIRYSIFSFTFFTTTSHSHLDKVANNDIVVVSDQSLPFYLTSVVIIRHERIRGYGTLKDFGKKRCVSLNCQMCEDVWREHFEEDEVTFISMEQLKCFFRELIYRYCC